MWESQRLSRYLSKEKQNLEEKEMGKPVGLQLSGFYQETQILALPRSGRVRFKKNVREVAVEAELSFGAKLRSH